MRIVITNNLSKFLEYRYIFLISTYDGLLFERKLQIYWLGQKCKFISLEDIPVVRI